MTGSAPQSEAKCDSQLSVTRAEDDVEMSSLEGEATPPKADQTCVRKTQDAGRRPHFSFSRSLSSLQSLSRQEVRRYLVRGASLLLIATLTVVFWTQGTRALRRLMAWLDDQSLPRWAICGILYVSHVAIGVTVFPGVSLVMMASGFMLDFWLGYLINYVATFSASALCFLLGKTCMQRRVNAWLNKDDASSLVVSRAFLRAVGHFAGKGGVQGFTLLLLLRLCVFPLAVKNYGPVAMGVSFRAFIGSVLLCSHLFCFGLAFVGSTAFSLVSEDEKNEQSSSPSSSSSSGVRAVQVLLIVVSFASLGLISALALLLLRRVLKSVRDEEEEKEKVACQGQQQQTHEIGDVTSSQGTDDSMAA